MTMNTRWKWPRHAVCASFLVLFGLFGILFPSFAQEEEEDGDGLLAVSVEKYSQMALERSLRSQSVEESFTSSKWSWLAGRRRLTWPQVTASASSARSLSDDDVGTESTTDSREANLTLNQPFLTGTDLAVSGTLSETDTETEYLGDTTISETREDPYVSASLTQPLFVFVKNPEWRSWKINNLQWEDSQNYYRQERLRIEYDARSLYYDLMLWMETENVEQKKYRSIQQAHEVTDSLVKQRKLPLVELSRVDIVAKQDLRRIQTTQINYEQALNQAKDFVLMSPDQKFRPTSQLEYTPFTIPLKRLIEVALVENPQVRLSRNRVRLSEYNLQEIKEGNNVRLNLSGTYSKTFDEPYYGENLDPHAWDARVDATWPLFDASQTSLSAKQSAISLRNAERAYENDVRQLRVSVKNAYLELKRIEEQIAGFAEQKEIAEDNVIKIRKQFQKGISRLNDVFSSEDEVRNLSLEYLSLLVSFNRARDGLKLLVGRDLNFE